MDRLRAAPRPTLRRIVLIAALGAVIATSIGSATRPAPVQASTATTMQSELLGWINHARASRGLTPLRLLGSLVSLAEDRAASMARTGTLSHPSCLGCTFTGRGIQWYTCGEDIAETWYPWGDQAALSIFNSWKSSSGHWAILMSTRYNYIGIGVAYRSGNGATFAAADLTESVDQTRPWAKLGNVSRSGSTVTWTWSGNDVRLQTHTAGLKNYDVQYRVDSGSWITIRSGTTATSLSLSGRAGGHYYGLRLRDRDNKGYLSSFTPELRIWVP
jgi:uncharacterized protein YkwD